MKAIIKSTTGSDYSEELNKRGVEFKYFTLKDANDLFNTHEVQLTILIITVISYAFNRIEDLGDD